MKKIVFFGLLALSALAFAWIMGDIQGTWHVIEVDPRTGEIIGDHYYYFTRCCPGWYGDYNGTIYEGDVSVGFCIITLTDPPKYYDIEFHFDDGKHYRCHIFSNCLILGTGVNPEGDYLRDIWIDGRR